MLLAMRRWLCRSASSGSLCDTRVRSEISCAVNPPMREPTLENRPSKRAARRERLLRPDLGVCLPNPGLRQSRQNPLNRFGREESRNFSISQARWRRQFLFLFNLEAIGPNVDAHAFGLLAILIQLIPHYRDDNYQRAYD